MLTLQQSLIFVLRFKSFLLIQIRIVAIQIRQLNYKLIFFFLFFRIFDDSYNQLVVSCQNQQLCEKNMKKNVCTIFFFALQLQEEYKSSFALQNYPLALNTHFSHSTSRYSLPLIFLITFKQISKLLTRWKHNEEIKITGV